MTVLLASKARDLCLLARHEVDSFDATSDDPGADVCREEGCLSEALVALWNASQCLREASAHLLSCPSEPSALRCMVGLSEERVDQRLSALLSRAFPSGSNDAEATLAGLDPG